MAYEARRGGWAFMVIDGQEGPFCDAIQKPGPRFDSLGRLHYAARTGRHRWIVIDGQESKTFDFISEDPPRWSPDGSRVGWRITRGKDWFVFIDGKEWGPYGNTAEGEPIFSPDGRRFVYSILLADGKWQMILDGKPLRQPGQFHREQFSPDGRRLAFAEWQGEKARIVLHDAEAKGAEEKWAEGTWFDGVRCLQLSPDGRHWACGAKSGDRHLLVVDGLESPGYDDIPKDAPIVFDSPTSVHAIFVKGGALVRVRAELRQVCR
jgi:hypothetical protein